MGEEGTIVQGSWFIQEVGRHALINEDGQVVVGTRWSRWVEGTRSVGDEESKGNQSIGGLTRPSRIQIM